MTQPIQPIQTSSGFVTRLLQLDSTQRAANLELLTNAQRALIQSALQNIWTDLNTPVDGQKAQEILTILSQKHQHRTVLKIVVFIKNHFIRAKLKADELDKQIAQAPGASILTSGQSETQKRDSLRGAIELKETLKTDLEEIQGLVQGLKRTLLPQEWRGQEPDWNALSQLGLRGAVRQLQTAWDDPKHQGLKAALKAALQLEPRLALSDSTRILDKWDTMPENEAVSYLKSLDIRWMRCMKGELLPPKEQELKRHLKSLKSNWDDSHNARWKDQLRGVIGTNIFLRPPAEQSNSVSLDQLDATARNQYLDDLDAHWTMLVSSQALGEKFLENALDHVLRHADQKSQEHWKTLDKPGVLAQRRAIEERKEAVLTRLKGVEDQSLGSYWRERLSIEFLSNPSKSSGAPDFLQQSLEDPKRSFSGYHRLLSAMRYSEEAIQASLSIIKQETQILSSYLQNPMVE